MELLHALHALDVRLPGGREVRGGAFVRRRGGAAGAAAGSAAASGRQPLHEPILDLATLEPIREWVLEAYEDPDNGKQLLLDPDTNVVYLPPDKVCMPRGLLNPAVFTRCACLEVPSTGTSVLEFFSTSHKAHVSKSPSPPAGRKCPGSLPLCRTCTRCLELSPSLSTQKVWKGTVRVYPFLSPHHRPLNTCGTHTSTPPPTILTPLPSTNRTIAGPRPLARSTASASCAAPRRFSRTFCRCWTESCASAT
eukprot:354017-Chlamydomonas_euryale.AAC.3